jgi:hypothetical protein
VVAELFSSISDNEDDDGGEFCWRDETLGSMYKPSHGVFALVNLILTKRQAC